MISWQSKICNIHYFPLTLLNIQYQIKQKDCIIQVYTSQLEELGVSTQCTPSLILIERIPEDLLKWKKWKGQQSAKNWTQDTWLTQPVLCHWATTTGQPPVLTILYLYCTGGTEMPQSQTRQPLSMSVRTVLVVDQKSLHHERTQVECFILIQMLKTLACRKAC